MVCWLLVGGWWLGYVVQPLSFQKVSPAMMNNMILPRVTHA